jgi:hypothetical protein
LRALGGIEGPGWDGIKVVSVFLARRATGSAGMRRPAPAAFPCKPPFRVCTAARRGCSSRAARCSWLHASSGSAWWSRLPSSPGGDLRVGFFRPFAAVRTHACTRIAGQLALPRCSGGSIEPRRRGASTAVGYRARLGPHALIQALARISSEPAAAQLLARGASSTAWPAGEALYEGPAELRLRSGPGRGS